MHVARGGGGGDVAWPASRRIGVGVGVQPSLERCRARSEVAGTEDGDGG